MPLPTHAAIHFPPTFVRFVSYKLLTLVPVTAALTAMLRHGDSLAWPLLLLYALGIAGLVLSIALNECSRCPHFDCGNCSVPEAVRRAIVDTKGGRC
jgi:hypothetical protein